MLILVIDDSKAMRMIVKRTLKKAGFGDHDIVEAGDGVEGLRVIQESSPDLVMADWNMPNMSGMELLMKIRELEIDVPFGFVTSESTSEMRDRAEEAGALFFITKPFTAEAFEQNLGELVS